MANFDIAYKHVKKWEGGYVNDPADSGGQTYMGIARKFNPNWSGWKLIDAYIAQNGEPKRGGFLNIKGLEAAVKEYFRQKYWNSIKGDKIKNQDVANILFDFNVLSESIAKKTAQQIANALGANLKVDGIIGNLTIAAINSLNPKVYFQTIKAWREDHFKRLANARPKDKKFLPGWLNRLNEFPDLIKDFTLDVKKKQVTQGLLHYSLQFQSLD